MIFSFILFFKSEFFEGINNEKVNEIFSGNKKTSDYNLNICLNKNLLHEGLLNKIENSMKELHVNDEKISYLILKKTVELEVENKALQENNKKITKHLKILEKSIRQAQNKIKCLNKSYKKLKSENNNLFADLKTIKQMKIKETLFSRLFKWLSRNTREKQDDKIHNVQSTNCYSTKGTLIKLKLKLNVLKIYKT